MLPFDYGEEVGPDYEMLEIVRECMDKLSTQDQEILFTIFFDRETYQKLTDTLNIKAKSHAWRKTRKAMDRLKEQLMEHPRFKEKWDERNK